MIDYFLNPQTVEALGWTLLHSIWQGAVFALLLVFILIALRSYTAQSRYVVSVGLLCAFFFTVSASFYQKYQEVNHQYEMTALVNSQGNDQVLTTINSPTTAIIASNADPSQLQVNNQVVANDQASWITSFKAYYENHLPLLVTIWFMGILFLQLRFLGQLAYVQRLKHYGTQLFPTSWSNKIEELEGKLRIQKKVAYLTSLRIESPMVIGWLKPVVLLPQQLFNSLSETEIYAVLAHELAHIRREDFIVNLVQTLLCNIFFFHPGVWWMSNRIDDEREHCCDDLAVAATGPATSYAKTLINVSKIQLNRQGNVSLAMAFSGNRKKGGFSDRIRRLFMVSNGAGTFREGFATACILISALLLGAVATGRTVQEDESSSNVDKTEINLETDLSLKEDNPIDDRPTLKSNGRSNVNEERFTTTSDSIPQNETKIINTIIEIGQDEKINNLPIAAPIPPVNPVEPQAPHRIDTYYTDTGTDTAIDTLLMAIEDGDFNYVEKLVNNGVDINGIGSVGFTPLIAAASDNEYKIVAYLIEQGADVNYNINGWNALIEAADEGSLESMELLLMADADVNYFWSFGSPTAITMAASEGHLECLKLLIQYGADINGIKKSFPPLHTAAEEDKRDIIDYLISQNVKLNKKDMAGRTALMYAAAEGNLYSVKMLIEAGADKSITDLRGHQAIDYSEDEEVYDVVDYLNGERNEKRPDIHQATLDGKIEKVERMVKQGVDINTRDVYGRTALHLAAAKNHNIDMQVLIDLGANINAQDNQDRTPLMYAAADGKQGAAVLLVSRLAEVNIQDVDGMTAYDWSLSGDNTDLSRFLGLITETNKDRIKGDLKKREKQAERQSEIQSEKTSDKRNQQTVTQQRESFHINGNSTHLKQYNVGKIPSLLDATKNGSITDCKKLLNNGSRVDDSDSTGQTALMIAARNNRLDIAGFLIERGADVNLSSSSGVTALHYAALENHDQMSQLLLDNGAKVDATMRYSSTDGNYTKEALVWEYIGATPLLIAVESGKLEVASILINAYANKNQVIIKNEYRLSKDRNSYLDASEVMGLDEDFLKHVEVKVSDETWTPYKQAQLLNEPAMLALFQK